MPPLFTTVLISAGAVLSIASRSPSDPVANPASVATFNGLRATFLTPSLVRLEVTQLPNQWDDRATLRVVNRYLPPVSFSRAQLNATAVQLTTQNLTITYVEYAPADACSNVQEGVHDDNLPRSPSWPNGTSVKDVGACCATCQADTFCGSYTFATVGTGINCWLLVGSAPPVPQANRTYGVPRAFSLSATFLGPSGETLSWTPGLDDPENLNGTYSALDCYSTPMQCNAEYDTRMGPGLLSASGWTALDDTAT
jgi:hypothetical protein